MSDPALVTLALSDAPERWEALGFAVDGSRLRLGGITLELGALGEGIVGWRLRGVDPDGSIDGLPWATSTPGPSGAEASHPNGASGIDHVVVVTGDFDRTAGALERAGIPLRRVRDAGGFRQGFRRLGPAILELVEADGAPRERPASFWGLVVIVEDLEALAERLGERLGRIKPAVQPGRRIATLRESAGIGTKLAFMDPE